MLFIISKIRQINARMKKELIINLTIKNRIKEYIIVKTYIKIMENDWLYEFQTHIKRFILLIMLMAIILLLILILY
tara:strand:- start:76 stop:303 length:228 start_codon:yes stop_codon:yes gene_type:complete